MENPQVGTALVEVLGVKGVSATILSPATMRAKASAMLKSERRIPEG
jgi:hypothetical protein